MPHLPPPLQVPFTGSSGRQHDDATQTQVSFSSPKCFLSIERATKIDDEHVARDGGRTEVILGVMDLRHIDANPTPTAAREQDVLRGHVWGFVGRRSILGSRASFG